MWKVLANLEPHYQYKLEIRREVPSFLKMKQKKTSLKKTVAVSLGAVGFPTQK